MANRKTSNTDTLNQQASEFACVVNLPKSWSSSLAFETALKTGCYKLSSLGYDYAYIIHDRDTLEDTGELKTLHAHLVLITPKRMRIKTLINTLHDILELPLNCISVDKAMNIASSIQYLTHKNDPQKYQYSFDSVCTNMSPDTLREYFLKVKKQDVTFSYLWNLIVYKGYDDIQIMAVIGLTRFTQLEKAITRIRHCNAIVDEIYRNKVESVMKEVDEDETT